MTIHSPFLPYASPMYNQSKPLATPVHEESAMNPNKITCSIELDREVDGRWIAEIPEFPGAMVYGSSKENAIALVKALALEILAGQLENGETPYNLNTIAFAL